jgi:hypothetical protein
VVHTALIAQVFPENEAQFDSMYDVRIKKTEIDGVYIPVDMDDAFAELKRLSSPADLEKLRQASEDVVRHKLHFGLGRWMIVNWGLYEGSRLSHSLKEAGLETPDDMARVLLVCFHRHLNGQPLRFEEEIVFYKSLRDKERAEREEARKVIFEETRIRKQE